MCKALDYLLLQTINNNSTINKKLINNERKTFNKLKYWLYLKILFWTRNKILIENSIISKLWRLESFCSMEYSKRFKIKISLEEHSTLVLKKKKITKYITLYIPVFKFIRVKHACSSQKTTSRTRLSPFTMTTGDQTQVVKFDGRCILSAEPSHQPTLMISIVEPPGSLLTYPLSNSVSLDLKQSLLFITIKYQEQRVFDHTN